MSFSRLIIVLLLLAGPRGLHAEEPQSPTHRPVLVLRNGFVLQGQVTSIDDSLIVTMGENGEVRLPRSEVAYQCASLDEAYLQQRNALTSQDPATHLGLADWCLRHGLVDRAADQLLVVFSIDPEHPRIVHLERRLQALAMPPTASMSSSPALAAAPPPVSPELRLSPRLMQQFTMIVQPILLNRCATYTCHGTGATNKYQLIRTASGSAPTSRMTHRNLQATFSYIDHEHAESSPLLRQAQTAHGESTNPPFADKQLQQLEILTTWVRSAAIRPAASVATDRGGPRSVAEHTRSQAARHDPPPASPAGPSTVAPAGYDQPESALEQAPNSPTPRDPFDPDVFNRRFHPDRKP